MLNTAHFDLVPRSVRTSALIACGALLLVPACAQQASSPNETEHVRAGMQMLQESQPQAALGEFRAASKLNPGSASDLIWIGITENRLGNFQQAATAFRSSLKIDPNQPSAHYNLAQSLTQLGDIKGAIRELETVLRTNPDAAEAHYNLAVLQQRTGDYRNSIPNLEAVARQHPEDQATQAYLIRAHLATQQPEQAHQLTVALLAAQPDSSLLLQLGRWMVENGFFQEAKQVLDHTDAGASSQSALLLARAEIGAGDTDKAIQLLSPLELSDTTGEVAYNLALAYLKRGQTNEAADMFRTALRLHPEDAHIHYLLGSILISSQDASTQQQGAQELEKAIELDSHQAAAYVQLGRWLIARNQVKPAAALLEKAIQNSPPSPESSLLLGIALAADNNLSGARPHIQKAAELDPRLALAQNLNGFCFFHDGDYEHALAAYQHAVALAPQNAHFAYDVALTLERLNRIPEALPYAEQATRDDDSFSAAHYLLGKLYAKAHRSSDAIHELQRTIDLKPSDAAPYYLLARTYMEGGDAAKAQEWNQKFQALKQAQRTNDGIGPPSSDSSNQLDPSFVLEHTVKATTEKPQ